MDADAARRGIARAWAALRPTLEAYVAIPNESPAFDPAWREHGHVQRATALVADWMRTHAPAGTTIEVVQYDADDGMGGGVRPLAVFPSARAAIAGALRCRDAGSTAGLPLHLGLHAGDVIDEGDNVFGGVVNLAARVAAAAAPGEVLITDTMRSLARNSAEVAFTARGSEVLKGIADPQALFAVEFR
jgi:class 3 adenylate cyclase